MQRHELEAWLGPALPNLTDDQITRLLAESARIDERYPDPDEQDLRDAALSAATQYVLGETTLDDAGRTLTLARLAEARAYAASFQLAVMTLADAEAPNEAGTARRSGLDRMTIRKILGKR